mmetsp:Transcript_26476/g.61396  ORF Transcript_26476/g.61396 Transcript_26476/m.61396 type:complete len:212 (-) Transcript_26476:6-641(-)
MSALRALRFETLLVTDDTPLLCILSLLGLRRPPRAPMSTSIRRVPWWRALGGASLYAAPETLHPPTTMSLRPLASAVSPKSASALMMISVFRSLSWLSTDVRNVKFVLPLSWYTAPPPLDRLARCTPALCIFCTLTSFQGFWHLPITTVGSLRQRYRVGMLTSPVRNSHSSVARLKKGFVVWETSTRALAAELMRLTPRIPSEKRRRPSIF